MKFLRSLLFSSTLLCSCLLGANNHLSLSDIEPTIKQILSVHVLYNQLDEKLFARIIDNYFQEFDPLKLYLLQPEIDGYVKASPDFYQKALIQFQNKDYKLFEDMNRVIQKSIWRARQWNRELLNNSKKDPELSFKDLDPLQPRTKNIAQLQARWSIFWNSREASEKEGIKEWITSHEDEYLYRSLDGKRMSQEQIDQFFALHILKAVASSLDAHTAVFSPEEARNVREKLEQSYVGIGIWFENQGGRWVVKQLVQGSPAEKSGSLQPGDILISVGSFVAKADPHILEKIEGEEGQSLHLVFERAGKEIEVDLQFQAVSLDRHRLKYSSRPYKGGGIIGYIGMDSFYENSKEGGPSSHSDMLEAIRKLQAEEDLRGIILDLRANSGGFLEQAVKVAGLFIQTGVVAIAKYSDGSMSYFRDMDPSRVYNGPILVMTSRLSASASEIVAQALQDYGIALVMGDHATFGKGTLQAQTLLDEGTKAHYKVTVGRYYTVSGKSTQLHGVPIDFVVPGPYDQKAIGESYEPRPLLSDKIPPAYIDPLTDVKAEDRLWFIQHYLPVLQQPSMHWKPYIARLREASRYRVESYFKKRPYDQTQHRELYEFQIEEAHRIIEDMIEVASSRS